MKFPLIGLCRHCLRISVLFGVVLATGGCVAFENLPDAPTGCDPRLAGQWQSQTQRPSDKLVFNIDQQCRYLDNDTSRKRSKGMPVTFRTLTVNGVDYAAFTPQDFDILLDEPGATSQYLRHNQVFLLRYRLDGDQLQVDVVNPNWVDQALRNKQLPVDKSIDKVLVLTGTPAKISKQLTTQPDLFGPDKEPSQDKDKLLFRRIGPAATNQQQP